VDGRLVDLLAIAALQHLADEGLHALLGDVVGFVARGQLGLGENGVEQGAFGCSGRFGLGFGAHERCPWWWRGKLEPGPGPFTRRRARPSTWREPHRPRAGSESSCETPARCRADP